MSTTSNSKIKIIVTGASGMVGEGVLLTCLQREDCRSCTGCEGRKPCGTTHPKLKEIIHPDFFNLSPIESQLNNYDACLFLSWCFISWHEGRSVITK